MIIKFSKNIELSDWTTNPQPDIKSYPQSTHYHRVYKTSENKYVVGVSIKEVPLFECIDEFINLYDVMFYYHLTFLHNYIPNDKLSGSLDFAKNYVDNFLIKMSKLTAFI